MKDIVVKCDVCGKSSAKSYEYVDGYEMDISGNGYNPKWKYIDLCFNCVQDFILKNKVRLSETTNGHSTKKILYG